MQIRNTSPLGDLDVTLLGRVVTAGEVIDVTEEQAVELCSGLANFVPVEGEELAAAVLAHGGEEFAQRYLAEAAGIPVDALAEPPSTEPPAELAEPEDAPTAPDAPDEPAPKSAKTKSEGK